MLNKWQSWAWKSNVLSANQCVVLYVGRGFLSAQYFNILTHSLLTQIKQRHHKGQKVLLKWKEPGHCCRSPFAQESCSPCIRLLVWKPSSSLSTVAGSKQKVLIFSSRYQLKFSSTMLNIRAKALAAPVPSIEVSSAVPKLQTKRKSIKKVLEGIEFKSGNNFGVLKEIWCSAHDLQGRMNLT